MKLTRARANVGDYIEFVKAARITQTEIHNDIRVKQANQGWMNGIGNHEGTGNMGYQRKQGGSGSGSYQGLVAGGIFD